MLVEDLVQVVFVLNRGFHEEFGASAVREAVVKDSVSSAIGNRARDREVLTKLGFRAGAGPPTGSFAIDFGHLFPSEFVHVGPFLAQESLVEIFPFFVYDPTSFVRGFLLNI